MKYISKLNIKRLIAMLIVFVTVMSICVTTVFADENVYKVTAQTAVLYEAPSINSKTVEELTLSAVLKKLDSSETEADGYTWYHMENVATKKQGYLQSDLIKEAEGYDSYYIEDSSKETNFGYYKVNVDKLNMRKEASYDAEKLEILTADTVLVKISESDIIMDDETWFEVKIYGTSKRGFVVSRYLTEYAFNGGEGEKSEYYKVNATNVNVREKATTSSNKLDTLPKGTILKRLDNSSTVANGFTWYHIRIVDTGTEGYIATKYIEATDAPKPEAPFEPEYYEVKSNTLNLRKNATTSSNKLTQLTKGAKLTRIDGKKIESGGYTWYHVSVDGTDLLGYVANCYLKETEAPIQPKPVIEPTEPTQPTEPAEPTEPTQPTEPEIVEEPLTDYGKYIVTASEVNVREDATTSSAKLTLLKKGVKLIRLDESELQADGYTWLHIKVEGKEVEGYVVKKYVAEYDEENQLDDYYIVSASQACLRANATTGAEILEILVTEAQVIRLDDSAVTADGYTWYHVKSKTSGTEGYIVSSFIRAYTANTVVGDYETRIFYSVSASEVNMRKAPNLNGEVIETLGRGVTVELINEEKVTADGYTWLNIRVIANDKEGYIVEKYAKRVSTELGGEVYVDSSTGRTYTTYNQGDDAWGFSTSVKKNACLISAYAMCVTNYGIPTTPKDIYIANGNSTGGNLTTIAKNIGVKCVCALSSSSPYLDSYSTSGRTYVKDPSNNAEAAIKEAIDRNPEGVVIFFEKGSKGHAVVAVKYDSKGILFCDSGRAKGSMIYWNDTWCKYKHGMSLSDIDYIMAID